MFKAGVLIAIAAGSFFLVSPLRSMLHSEPTLEFFFIWSVSFGLVVDGARLVLWVIERSLKCLTA